MFAVPLLTAVAKPATLIVATACVSEAHTTLFVMSAVLPSEKTPLAVNCCVLPAAMEVAAGVTVIEVR
jgi:hypothetical protein